MDSGGGTIIVTVEQIHRQCEEELIVCCYDPSLEWVLVTPPGIGESRKHNVGFYREQELIPVMDMIDGYPREDTAFIGFFMVSSVLQRHGICSGIIGDTAAYLKRIGKAAIQLGIDQGNPQSTALWKKNDFQVPKEVKRDCGIILLAQRTLMPAFP